MAELKYADVFLTERPKDGIDVVQTRLKKAFGLNNEMAEYFKERAHIEDQYAKSLLKLSKKVFLTDKASLGTFTPICDMLFQEVEEVAKVHQTMASRITEEVEKPLRVKVMDADWRKLNSYEKTLEAYGRDYDDRHARYMKQKASKDKKKSDSAEKKYSDAKNALEEVRMAWKLEGPEILEKHQHVDEARLNSLRDAVTVFERIHTQQCMKRVEYADVTLAAAASFDVKQEIDVFAANRLQTMKTLRKSLSLDDITSNFRRPSSATGISVSSDNSHEVTDSNISASLEPERIPTPMPSKQDMIRPPLSPSLKPEGSKLGVNLLNGLKSIRRRTRNEGSFSGFSVQSRDFQDASYSSSNNDDTFGAEPMSSFDNDAPRPSISLSSESARSQSTIPPLPTTNGLKPNIDENGFTIPPPDHPPWETSPVMSDSMSFEDGSENGSMFGQQSRIKVEIKDEVVSAEKTEEAHQALNRVSTMLQSKNTVRTRQGARGRRTEPRPTSAYNSFGTSIPDINTNANRLTPITDNGTSPIPSPTSSFGVSTPPAALGAINPFEQSVFDMQIPTLVLSAPQIKSSIVEHVNVLSQGSNIAKILITGDITFSLSGAVEGNPDTSSASFQILDFASLEKVTPNTAYVKPVEDQPGIFKINTHLLSLAGGAPIVVLKYQVRVSEEDIQSKIPLFVQPLWRCEEGKTMLMVRYHGNPIFHLDGKSTKASSTETELRELNFLVPVDGGVTNVQSIPTGIWSVEKQKILWHVNDLPVGEGVDPDVPNKLLAKFETTGMGTPRTVAVKFSVKGRLFSGVRAVVLNEDEESSKLEILEGGVEIKSGKYLAEP